MAKKSFRHGTVEGYRHCKPPCAKCTTANATGKDLPTEPIPVISNGSNGYDLVAFIRECRFNHLIIDQVLDGWSVEIKHAGDKYVGFGTRPDYALSEAVRRYTTSQPATAPITMTYDPTTYETSQGRALADDTTTGIEEIWQQNTSESQDSGTPD